MAKQKSTKKALLSSVLALVLCLSMLIGTTFAWFTDSVTSGKNQITAGNLDIELDYYNGKDWASVEKASDLFTGELWEPGHTEVVYLRLTNKGTLALKYQLGVNVVSETGSINVEGDEFKLSEYIEYGVVEDKQPSYANRAEAVAAVEADSVALAGGYAKSGTMTKQNDELYLAMVVYMPETVGNEANYATGEAVPQIDLGINLIATQYTYEGDSFGIDYDANAHALGQDVKGNYLLYTAEDLMSVSSVIANTSHGEGRALNFKLMADVDMSGYTWEPLNMLWVNFDGNGHTISNLKCAEVDNKSGFVGYLGGTTISNLTLENASVSGSQAGLFAGQAEGGNIINCTVKGSNMIAWDDASTDTVTGNGVGIFVGVSVSYSVNNKISGTIASDAEIYTVPVDAANAWTYNDEYAGGIWESSVYTVLDVVLDIDDKRTTDTTEITEVSDGLYVAEKKDYYVADETGIAALKTLVENDAAEENSGTFTLLADIDMNGATWDSIGTDSSSGKFYGTFDGNGHTISNFKVEGEKFAGLFGMVVGTIKNLTVKNATVSGEHVGAIVGKMYGNVENCKVIDCVVTGTTNIGGAIGMLTGNEGISCTVSDCVVSGTTVSGSGNVGWLIGRAVSEQSKQTVTVSGCSISEETALGIIGDDYFKNCIIK